jgi:hypothetical protein
VTYTPGQLLDGKRVDIGGIQLGMVDSSSVAWRIGADGLQGWDSAEVRAEYTPREADHGAWASPVYLSERPITLAGTIVASTADALDLAVDRLLESVALEDVLLVVYDAIPRQAWVRRSGKPLVHYETDLVATYSVMVTAADPRRYATELSSHETPLPSTTGGLTIPVAVPFTIDATTDEGQILAFNAGSFETRPVFTITGPVTGPRIHTQHPDGTVKTLTLNVTLGSGDEVVIDTDRHTVVLNGSVSRRRYLSGEWPVIGARQEVSFQFRASTYNATARLTATWRSAWI